MNTNDEAIAAARKMIAEAFDRQFTSSRGWTDGYSTSVTAAPETTEESDAGVSWSFLAQLEAIHKRLEAMMSPYLIEKIVLTDYPLNGNMLRVEYEGKWYILVEEAEFEKLLPEIKRIKPDPDQPYISPPLTGIPVVKDEVLFWKIVFSTLSRAEMENKEA